MSRTPDKLPLPLPEGSESFGRLPFKLATPFGSLWLPMAPFGSPWPGSLWLPSDSEVRRSPLAPSPSELEPQAELPLPLPELASQARGPGGASESLRVTESGP
jgi:hypothetical protein